MGFLNSKDNSNKLGGAYLEITEDAKHVRPLAKQPVSIWVHGVSSIKSVGPDGMPRTVRKYATELCVSTGRSGAGCLPCTTQDPLWAQLEAKNKFNKKGQVTHFPKKMIHVLPVLDVSSGKVLLMKGGNQLYESMDRWFDSQPETGKDLRRCEWRIWKTGKELFTKYHADRLDATAFTVTPEMEVEAQQAVDKGMADMAPLKLEAWMAVISGDANPMADATNVASVAVPQQAAPSFPAAEEAPKGPSFAFSPAPATAQTPPPAAAAPVVPPATGHLEEFTVWINSQPEFQAVGMFNNLIPVLQEKIGGVNYHICTPDQLTMLKAALVAKLDTLRANKV